MDSDENNYLFRLVKDSLANDKLLYLYDEITSVLEYFDYLLHCYALASNKNMIHKIERMLKNIWNDNYDTPEMFLDAINDIVKTKGDIMSMKKIQKLFDHDHGNLELLNSIKDKDKLKQLLTNLKDEDDYYVFVDERSSIEVIITAMEVWEVTLEDINGTIRGIIDKNILNHINQLFSQV